MNLLKLICDIIYKVVAAECIRSYRFKIIKIGSTHMKFPGVEKFYARIYAQDAIGATLAMRKLYPENKGYYIYLLEAENVNSTNALKYPVVRRNPSNICSV